MTQQQYRIEPRDGGFEAQILYNCGVVDRDEWFSLDAAGYWADPEAYTTGLQSRRVTFDTREEAASAIAKARAINGG